ncbi:hypothetical protein CCAX7_20090 [Capsulimonas corticalis]|uniref:Uncharacterized protein n=1 Tax=Capsulimonas corticalis TaxID=2219043 RepID=A0A402D2G2_9BACT|nr:hypothetical protein [Capsulimonas corticalis]BDI29958.1 hypothetical protein CCAX7_20090 [Capsulimonas corticalis]
MKSKPSQQPIRRPIVAGIAAGMAITAYGAPSHAAPTPAAGYQVKLFAAAPTGATGPDSIAVDNGHVFIGYGDKGGKTGGGTSTVAEFMTDGTLVKTFTVAGHNDGLKIDPATHLLWAMQNEDGNAQLAIIDPASASAPTVYSLPSVNGGGGYDDIVFRAGKVYFSASNPANDPNTGSAIVQATLTNGVFTLTPVLAGNAAATNALTNVATTLNLLDPDSLTTTPAGDLLLDSQGDNELIDISASTGAARVLPITVNAAGKADDNLDDTVFATSGQDTLLIADRDSNLVYAVTGLTAGQAYSAANDDNLVGALNMSTGVVSPIAAILQQPHGLGVLPVAHTYAAGLQMISAPADFSSVALDGVLDIAAPRFATWDPTLAQYVLSPSAPADTLHIGKGCWVRLASPARLFDQGVPASAAPFSIALTVGWNLIGDPFAGSTPVSSLQIQAGGKSYADLGLAAAAGIVSPLLYSYSPGDAAYAAHAYQKQTLASGTFASYKGYWIRAFQNCNLIVPGTTGN